MNDCQFYVLLREVRCATVREVAERLEISCKSARSRLEKLARIGAVEKRKISGGLCCTVSTRRAPNSHIKKTLGGRW